MATTTRQLRIAVVSDAIYPYHRGGKEMRLHHLTKNLAALGYDVHVYTMKWWDGAPDRTEYGVHLHAISKHYPLYVKGRRSIKQALMFWLACFKLIRADFDILEVDHMPYFPLFAGKIVSVLKRRPMYATWHEVWGRDYWRQYLGAAGLIGYALERLTILLPNHIIAVSPHTAERLRTMMRYRGPLSIAPNGIDGTWIQSIKPAKETSDLIFVGRLLTHKNPALLVEAVAKLKRRHPSIRCIIVGDGPEAAHLRELVTKLGLENNVILKGTVAADSDVIALIKASRIFVLPSVREGFGVVALEAGACGLPVVTVNHPENAARHLVTRHTGALCQPTAASLAAAIERVLARELRNNSDELVATYNWQTIAATIAREYAA